LAEQRLERPRRQTNPLVREEETCLEGDPDDVRRFLENGQSDGNGGRLDTAVPETRKRKRQEDKTVFSQLREILFRFPVSPVVNIINHPVYLESDIGHLRMRHCKVQDFFDHIAASFISWSIKDYYTKIYSVNDCSPIFSAGHTAVDDYYYSIDESVGILDDFLMYQYNNDEEAVYNFLSNLYNILERKFPKRNCILVHSPPSAGKNFFFDCIIDYFLVRGQLASRINKTNNFPYQEAYGKRILLWNEPNYESNATDQLKMITGGDAYTVNVKNKPDAAVYKTPVIILTNNTINLMYSNAFKDRICMYKWREAPYLKDFNKKPYPLATYFIFKKHGFIK